MADPIDHVYICPGSCGAAVALPQQCGDPRCNLYQQPLQPVQAIYQCPGTCGESRISPGRCHQQNCSHYKSLLECKAVCPRSVQFPLWNPPEEQREYSSVWDNDPIGTGHARSKINSTQGWSALHNNTEQWLVIDAGRVLDSIAGVAITNRKDGCHNQIVTRIAVDIKTNEEQDWIEVVQDSPTNICSRDTDSFRLVMFDQTPMPARFIRIRPLEWQQHISMRCALVLHGDARKQFHEDIDNIEYRPVLDLNQLPQRIAVHSVPGGQPPPRGIPPRPYGVVHLPSRRTRWEGRQCDWTILNWNGQAIRDPNTRIFLAQPGQRCSIRVHYHAFWNFSRDDYCPGCIVQLYYGMADTFCTGVVEHGIRDHQGQSETEFVAPMGPGLYYITQSISLMYNYVDNLGCHQHTHKNAFAAVRVLPTVFTPGIFPVLPPLWQKQILAVMAFSRRDNTVFSTLGRGVLFHIFSFLLSAQNTTNHNLEDGIVQPEEQNNEGASWQRTNNSTDVAVVAVDDAKTHCCGIL